MESTFDSHSGDSAPWDLSVSGDRLAHPAILLVEDDLDDLVERLRYRAEDVGPRRDRGPEIASSPRQDGDDGAAGCPEPVELILYVSSQSARSFAAVRNIRNVLKRFKASRVKLTVCDLSQDPAAGIEDAVAFTPTLVRRTPGPRTFILGHVTNPELVMELLADCETEEN